MVERLFAPPKTLLCALVGRRQEQYDDHHSIIALIAKRRGNLNSPDNKMLEAARRLYDALSVVQVCLDSSSEANFPRRTVT